MSRVARAETRVTKQRAEAMFGVYQARPHMPRTSEVQVHACDPWDLGYVCAHLLEWATRSLSHSSYLLSLSQGLVPDVTWEPSLHGLAADGNHNSEL